MEECLPCLGEGFWILINIIDALTGIRREVVVLFRRVIPLLTGRANNILPVESSNRDPPHIEWVRDDSFPLR
jgi:hypothetical protein